MTPEEEEQVRRALGALADAEPPPALPPEVADRLDETLAELEREPRAAPRVASFSSPGRSAARRRRRHRVLAAAAGLVVVAGVGAAALTGGLGTSGGSGGSASSGGRAETRSGADTAPDTSSPQALAPDRSRPAVHTGTLRRDVRRVLAAGLGGSSPPLARCRRPEAAPGDRLLGIRLDGRAGTLLLGPERGGHRAVRVYGCSDADAPVATTRVRAP